LHRSNPLERTAQRGRLTVVATEDDRRLVVAIESAVILDLDALAADLVGICS
jgi:hypothetical protein